MIYPCVQSRRRAPRRQAPLSGESVQRRTRIPIRLGRGGGWYDRALAAATPGTPVWVLLNTDEVLPAIPVHPWDRPVDALLTPAALLPCHR